MEKKNASEIVQSVIVSMAIERGKQAWDEMSSDQIVKCFKKMKPYPEEIDDEDDPFEGENELSSLQQLVHEIDSTCDALTFISSEFKTRKMYERDISMTQIVSGGRRFGTISLMTKMMKLELAPEKANAEEVDLDEY